MWFVCLLDSSFVMVLVIFGLGNYFNDYVKKWMRKILSGFKFIYRFLDNGGKLVRGWKSCFWERVR